MNFYANYPATKPSSTSVTTVQGEGTAGSQTGGVLTVQGDPSGTPVPISGNITASSASVGPTGSPVPADGDYVGLNNGGTLIGAVGDSAGRQIVAGGGTAGTPAGGVLSIQGVGSGTAVPVSGTVAISGTVPVSGTVAATQSGTWNVGISAGSAIIGKVSIDQTTPGTTNGVQVNAALPAGANLVGKVGIDQTTPGTTNGVAVNTIAPVTTTTAVFQAEGSLAFGSITGLYQTVFTPTAATKILQMRNNCDVSISVSFDAGTTLNYVLDSGDAVSLDFLSNALAMSTTAIQIKQTSGGPTSGSFRVNGCH